MADIILQGLGVALVTPFKENIGIDYEALEKIIEHIISGGCDYIVVLGTTAENPTLTFEEKSQISKFVKDKTRGRVPLVMGVGGNDTHKVIGEIYESDLEGYKAILSVTPYYNKPTQEGLFLHYEAISKVSPLPIILYNVPGRTGVNLTAKTTKLLSEIPMIQGIKESSGNMKQCEEIINTTQGNFFLISGEDDLTYPLMKKGGVGVISVLANAFPKEVKQLVNFCNDQRYQEAELLQNSLNPLIKALFEEGNPAGVKFVMSRMGLCENIMRLPLTPVSYHLGEKLKKEAEKFLPGSNV